MRHAVYRHKSKAGLTLYIGVSSRPLRRLWEHRARSEWAREVATTDISWFDTRDEALAAEAEAIRKEKPAHNRVHNICVAHAGHVADVVSAIGPALISARLGLSRTNLGNAIAKGQFPCRWAAVISDLCREADVSCRMDAFPWKGGTVDSRDIRDVIQPEDAA